MAYEGTGRVGLSSASPTERDGRTWEHLVHVHRWREDHLVGVGTVGRRTESSSSAGEPAVLLLGDEDVRWHGLVHWRGLEAGRELSVRETGLRLVLGRDGMGY